MQHTRLISVTGIVQGVGFRPFIHNLAERFALTGSVLNTGGGVDITVTGDMDTLDSFIQAVSVEAPPQAHIAEITISDLPYTHFDSFSILPSAGKAGVVFVPVDLAVCPDCAAELDDPSNRRYMYPFINCTQCGPRYSIIYTLPYDRVSTVMNEFQMCPDCLKEYTNHEDRRYHAQPNACPVCGPHVWLGEYKALDALKKAAALIDSGEVLALKGLGGYHLVCDATNSAAVRKIRDFKNRPTKPLAVMCGDDAVFDTFPVEVKAAILSPKAPIVIFDWRGHNLSPLINPLNDQIGVMQAYTPLHRILLKLTATKLIVATSGNLQDEPIAADEAEAERVLSGVTKHFLHHNRKIYSRIDDSVATYAAGEVRLLRRGRGYAPFPVSFVSKKSAPVIFAAGAHLKATITFTKGRYAFVSGYVGDLDSADTVNFYRDTYGHIATMLKAAPDAVACDKHPGYYSSAFAKSLGACITEVQHHHAHLYSVMAEHSLTDNVVGIIMDGNGYGDDGAVWGGEIFTLCGGVLERSFHLENVLQPGGDAAARYPSRMAQSWMMQAGCWDEAFWSERMGMAALDVSLNAAMIKNKTNTLITSSAGRLFESVGAMVIGINRNEYEAHAAMALESIVSNSDGLYPFECADGEIILSGAVKSVAKDIYNNRNAHDIAAVWHNTFAKAVVSAAVKAADRAGVKDIVLSGGVFQNKILLEKVYGLIIKDGYNCYAHRDVPSNDGGISLGQAYYTYLRS